MHAAPVAQLGAGTAAEPLVVERLEPAAGLLARRRGADQRRPRSARGSGARPRRRAPRRVAAGAAIRRRTRSPGRSPGSRSDGAQATRAVSPVRSTGSATVPRSSPNSRVRMTTGTRHAPVARRLRGPDARRLHRRRAVRLADSSARKPANDCSDCVVGVSAQAASRSPRAQASAKRCAIARDGSSSPSRERTNANAPAASASSTTPARTGPTGEPPPATPSHGLQPAHRAGLVRRGGEHGAAAAAAHGPHGRPCHPAAE